MRLDCFSRLCEMITCDRCSSSIFRFQDKKVPLSPMCIVQIASKHACFWSCASHNQGRTPRVAHATHTQHAHNTPKYIHTQIHMQPTDNTCHTTHPPLPTHPLFTPYHRTVTTIRFNDYTMTTSTATPPSHLKYSRLYNHAPRNTSTKDRWRKQITPHLRNLLATKSSGHCREKFAAVMERMTSTVKTTKCKLHDFLRDRDL